MVYVYRNGVEIGRTTVRRVEIDGQHIYSALDGKDEQGRRKWIRVDGKPESTDPNIADMAKRAGIAEALHHWRAMPSSCPAPHSSSPTSR